MAIQIQLRPLGRGFKVKWSVYEQLRGSKLTKEAQKWVREFQREREYEVRIVRQGEENFITSLNGESDK